jgi:hypothetical protein
LGENVRRVAPTRTSQEPFSGLGEHGLCAEEENAYRKTAPDDDIGGATAVDSWVQDKTSVDGAPCPAAARDAQAPARASKAPEISGLSAIDRGDVHQHPIGTTAFVTGG